MTTNILLTLIAVLLAVWIVWLIRHKRNNPPKYQLGDTVRFADMGIMRIGKIWKIHKHWLREPSYRVYCYLIGGIGNTYTVSKSDIMELIERTNETPPNPLEPKNK